MPPVPSNETARLAALRGLGILDTQPEAHFDAVCRLARDLFAVPIALVSFVDEDRQWFKAKCGVSEDGTSREIAFCNYTITSEEVFVVEDAARDPRFANNPLVHGAQGIRFYAGAPLTLASGHRVGAFCIKDTRPRTFSTDQVRQLRDLAEIVVAHLRLHEAKQAGERHTERLADTNRILVERDAALQVVRDVQRVAETTASFGHWRIHVADRTVVWSDGIAAIFDRPMPEGGLLDLDQHLSFYHPDDRTDIQARIEAVIAGTDPDTRDGYQGQARAVRPDGKERVVMIRGIPVRDEAGAVATIYGIILDVTEHAHTQAQLQETGALLRMTLENMDQGLILLGPDKTVRLHNQRARELLDLPGAVLHDGSPYSAINRYQVARGEYRTSPDHLTGALVAADLASLPNLYERQRPDGTSLEVRVVPLPGGGCVRTYSDTTSRRESERAVQDSEARLRASKERLAHALDSGSDGLWDWNLTTGAAWFSDRWYRMLGYEAGELDPHLNSWNRIIHPDDAERAVAAMRDHLKGMTPLYECEYRLLRKDGTPIHVLTRGRIVERDETGRALRIVGTQIDITRRKNAEDALRLSEERLALALDSGSDGLWDWSIATGEASVSGQYFRTLGYACGEIELNIRAWAGLLHPEDADTAWQRMMQHIKGLTPFYECEYRLRTKAGNYVWTLARGKVVSRDANGRALRMVGTYSDITSRKEAEQQISHLALHDALTGLPNRVLFRDRLDHEFANAGRHGSGFAVLACDLDRFKAVNDTLGHPAGDALLRVVAERLRGIVRESDTVARLGGDEFAVILSGLDGPQAASATAQRMIEAVGQPVILDGHIVSVGVSIGIALGPEDSACADTLFKHADIALYRAKDNGRNAYSFYEPGMDEQIARRTQLEADLREAVREGDFVLHYQPILDLATGTTSGFEALVRWQHPTRGLISPAEFIPLAEETEIIVPLGTWVLREACREAAGWANDLRVAVNVSAVQFRQPGLELSVLAALAASGLAPHRLELEITESVLLNDVAALGCLYRLRGMGVRLALDDFGAGYSSLSYLRRFPFDKIKIDRAFIREIGDPGAAVIVRAIVAIGAELGMSVTAEGVETPAQLDRVRREGCTEVQGYLYAKPLPGPEARTFGQTLTGKAVA